MSGTSRKAMVPSKANAPTKFPIAAFARRIEAEAVAAPDRAAEVYALAAERVRREARKPENAPERLDLTMIAREFDRVAAARAAADLEEVMGETEPEETGDPIMDDAVLAGSMSAGDKFTAGVIFDRLQTIRGVGNPDRPPIPVRPIPISASGDRTVFSDQSLVQYGGTSGSGSYTGSDGVSGPLVAKQETAVLRWRGKDDECQTITIHVFRIGSGAGANYPDGAFTAWRPFWHLFFGVSSSPIEVYGDVGRGCTFTLATSFLTLNVGMFPPIPGDPPPSMVLGASFGFYSAIRQSPVYRTSYVDDLDPGGANAQAIVIPAFAQTLEGVNSAVTATPSLALQFRTAGASPRIIGRYTITAPLTRSTAIPVPNDAYDCLVTNNGSADDIELIWSLAL